MESLPDRFRAWAAKQPSGPELIGPDGHLSYAEVDHRSDEVARQLADGGVPAGTLVGLVANRGVHVPIAILGILKHRCAYVPIDPAHPAARPPVRARRRRPAVGFRRGVRRPAADPG